MPKPRPLTPAEASRSVVARLGKTADKVRQVATKLGARPYRVSLVWSRWDGEERGEGTKREVKRIEILPTPRITSLDALSFNPFHAGVYPIGSVRVDEISTSLTEDQLRGLTFPVDAEEEVPESFDFWWELAYDGRDGREVRPQKYRILSPPYFDAENVQWKVSLERVSGDDPPRAPR